MHFDIKKSKNGGTHMYLTINQLTGFIFYKHVD